MAERVKVYLDEETDLHYIVGESCVLFENGVKVDVARFKNRKLHGMTVAAVIAEAVLDPSNTGFDFKKSMDTLRLQRKKAPVEEPVMPAVAVAEKENPVTETITSDESEKAEEKAAAVSFFSAPHADVILMLTVVGVLCFAMSVYNSFTFLKECNGKPDPVSAITSIAFCIFSASAFTAARHIFSDKGIGIVSRCVYSLALIVFGVLIIGYLVLSTVTVNFDQFIIRDDAKMASVVESSAGVVASKTIATSLDGQIASKEADKKRALDDADRWYPETVKPLPDESSDDPAVQKQITMRYNVAYAARAAAQKNYAAAQKLAEDARKELAALYSKKDAETGTTAAKVESASTKRRTAYSLISEKTGVAQSSIEFFVYTAPAVFFDIISPFALSIVLLLRDRRKMAGDAGNGGKEKWLKHGAELLRKLLSRFRSKVSG